jgi:hypothetical protein
MNRRRTAIQLSLLCAALIASSAAIASAQGVALTGGKKAQFKATDWSRRLA